MARDLSKYTPEQQEAIRAKRRARAAARRKRNAEKATQPTGGAAVTKPPRERRQPRKVETDEATFIIAGDPFGGEGYDHSHEDEILAAHGF